MKNKQKYVEYICNLYTRNLCPYKVRNIEILAEPYKYYSYFLNRKYALRIYTNIYSYCVNDYFNHEKIPKIIRNLLNSDNPMEIKLGLNLILNI